ncbi:chlorohydrolase/aminohydrolase [Enterococcus moraviensis ATCC BAA-383]|uniref:Chlorohydrolase/aminohydrolase n=1 Tax=Enterococcus moraviensis ATCC BAA-383 TaxID=1158609 RepID=R2TFC1_9ENTE|nr:putative aminohydrolase SsnA [Enterococcus moraviensis]EOH98854.1 chlorohydrolase/aminohydrolase [Enterococcus moraviensis ATCC BAA-383]EOT71971.1 chlorohydrolase/aminohydrolase [Enterococcus moraviensis ATCC BAA-383]
MLLVGNGRLITRDEEGTFFDDGCVAIEGEKIKAVGTTTEIKKQFPEAEFIDAKGGVIMPGFINMHNHIYSTFARGLSINGYHPKNFMDILEGQWWRIDRTLNLEDSYHSAKIAYLDSIKNGVTTVFDHHASYGAIEGSLTQLSTAADELGVRTCLCYEVSDRDGEEKMKAAVKENADFIKATAARTDDKQKAMMGMHAAFTLSDKSLEHCAAYTPEGVGYHIHIAEDIADVYDSLRKYGKPIVNRLYDLGILGKQTMAGHCIHINPHEMELLRDTNTMVVTNPESNMGNAVGCPPAMRMFNEYGILMGLGTDGYTNDITESYKVGNIIHKHHLADPNAAWAEIPQMLFNNNPQMANRYFEKKLGALEVDAAADVIVLDYKGPTPMTKENYNSHILFGMNGGAVTDTIINGDIRMRNREVQGVDEEKIWHDAQAQAQSLWHRINS